MTLTGIYFIYGLCVMFYFMMAWFFMRKNKELLSRLVMVLMLVIGIQNTKDLFFISAHPGFDSYLWMVVTSVDMTAVPLYAFVLIELCRPGSLTISKMILHEVPFIMLAVLIIVTGNEYIYYADVAWAAIYGIAYAIWTATAIPRYHMLLKHTFSYEENINLNWLRIILISFFAILSLWIMDCTVADLNIEAVYMLGSLIIWMFVCYFIYRHESVIDELAVPAAAGTDVAFSDESAENDELAQRIWHLFETERIFLDSQLKLSDVAARTNSNRTYISRYFNNLHGKTFFEFVNEYRVKHAMNLLDTTQEHLEIIAERSGFNSRQSFHRVFSKIAGCTPEQYRASCRNHKSE